jgi:xylulokinase
MATPTLVTEKAAKSPVIFAIDLGTSGPKVALVSAQGEILASCREETSTIFLPGGGAEQRPEEWWLAIVRATARLIEQNNAFLTKIAVISCTSQYSTTVAVDRSGVPLMNAINWRDTRGAPYVKEIVSGLIRFQGYGLLKLSKWIRRTGGAPARSGKDSLAHILYLQRERPEIYQAAYKFLEPKDHLNQRLTGRFAATQDSINLTWVTDNRDIANIHYDEELLALAGVERDKLPDLVGTTEIIGTLQPGPAAELGLPAGLSVVGGTTDAQSAAIGSGAVRDYEGHLYLGTSSWISCFAPFKKTDLLHNMATLPSAIPGRYSVADEQECAGACLTYLRDNLIFSNDELAVGSCPAKPYEIFDKVAAAVPAGSDRVLFLPWMYGERTPIEDHSVRGGFLNLSLRTPRTHLVRAVMEGVAYNSRWLLECVERFCGRQFPWLNAIGGGAGSDVWCQIFADVMNRTIRQVKDPLQANTRGAGLVGSVALGLTSFADISSRTEIARTFEPNPAHRAIYDELFREFLKSYRNNKAMFGRLNKHGK